MLIAHSRGTYLIQTRGDGLKKHKHGGCKCQISISSFSSEFNLPTHLFRAGANILAQKANKLDQAAQAIPAMSTTMIKTLQVNTDMHNSLKSDLNHEIIS